MKFKRGDKVVPLRKTRFTDTLESSINWEEAQRIGQGFLYVKGYDEGLDAFICGITIERGDYFAESDLVPYVENKQLEFAF